MPPLEIADLEAALAPFRGAIQQRPPQVSAVHVEGQRAYARVRGGETLDLAARPVRIEQLDLLGWDPGSGRLELAVTCSAGTYIRALARDLGEALGCGGCLAQLRRTAALGFDLRQAVSLEQLEAEAVPTLLDPLAALTHLPQQRLDPADLAWLALRPALRRRRAPSRRAGRGGARPGWQSGRHGQGRWTGSAATEAGVRCRWLSTARPDLANARWF